MPKITLHVSYRTPSLNVTKRQHWTKQYQEKQKAFAALSSALLATASDPSTLIILPEVSKTCSMAYDTLASSKVMSGGESNSKPSKSKSRTTKKRKQL